MRIVAGRHEYGSVNALRGLAQVLKIGMVARMKG